jgi:hypothetical protein
LCIARGVLSSFTFHNSVVWPTFAVVKIFSSRTHPVRAGSTPSVRKSDAMVDAPNARASSATPPHQQHIRRFVWITKRILGTELHREQGSTDGGTAFRDAKQPRCASGPLV